jgi:hypothetical protein
MADYLVPNLEHKKHFLKLREKIADIGRAIAVWCLQQFDDVIIIINSRQLSEMEHKLKNAKVKEVSLQTSTYVFGEKELMIGTWRAIFQEDPDFISSIIGPAIEQYFRDKDAGLVESEPETKVVVKKKKMVN